MIPFDVINQAALSNLPALLAGWFPAGKMQGKEYVLGDLSGAPGGSLSINVRTGTWKDFSSGEGGSDPISLVAAAFHHDKQADAARALAVELGIDVMSKAMAEDHRAPATPKKEVEQWFPADPPRGVADPPLGGYDGVWTYRTAVGARLGYVVRLNPNVRRSRKVILGINWGRRIWINEAGKREDKTGWHKKHPAAPMPLYGLDRLAARPDAPVIVVEGEKACDAATAMFSGHVCVTWPRGGDNVLHADWRPLAGRNVIIWPDNDPLNSHGVRPGSEAARKVVDQLRDIVASVVTLIVDDLSRGDKPDGEDAADITIEDPNAWLAAHMPQVDEAKPEPAHPRGHDEPDLEYALSNKAALAPDGWQEVIGRTIKHLNSKYALVNENGKAVIFQDGYDHLMHRRRIDRIATSDFRIMYLNNKIQTGVNDKGEAIYASIAQIWLSSPDRRQFIDGVVFDPATRQSRPGVLNLWKGYAVASAPGDWSLMRAHIRDVICDSKQDRFQYLMGWMARMLQFPAQQGEVAVVMKGGEGTGKGTLAKALIKIIGQHALQISNAKHLIGNFNGHLRDAIFLFADEAFFAADRAHVGVLKSIITEPYLTVEEKHKNAVQMPNFLHVIMASNEEWVIPASVDARRFFVLEVNDTAKNNHDYFADLWAQMDAGGYAAMLHELTSINLSRFNVRDVPKTGALQLQQKLSLPIPERWWKDCLERGYVFQSKIGLEHHLSIWFPAISTELLFASYLEFATSRHDRNIMSRETLGRFMIKMGTAGVRLSKSATGEHLTDVPNAFSGTSRAAQVITKDRPTGYKIGPLPDARAAFTDAIGLEIDWHDDYP